MNYPWHNNVSENTLIISESPTLFSKPDSALLRNGKPFFIPDFADEFIAEAALVVRIDRMGKSVPERFAHRYIGAITVGVDFTAQGLHTQATPLGLAWEQKCFDGSAIIGDWVTMDELENVDDIVFHLDVDGIQMQRGCMKDMRWSIPKLVSYVSRYNTLKTGDVLFTGTPSRAGAVCRNQHIEGWLDEKKVLSFNVK